MESDCNVPTKLLIPEAPHIEGVKTIPRNKRRVWVQKVYLFNRVGTV